MIKGTSTTLALHTGIKVIITMDSQLVQKIRCTVRFQANLATIRYTRLGTCTLIREHLDWRKFSSALALRLKTALLE